MAQERRAATGGALPHVCRDVEATRDAAVGQIDVADFRRSKFGFRRE